MTNFKADRERMEKQLDERMGSVKVVPMVPTLDSVAEFFKKPQGRDGFRLFLNGTMKINSTDKPDLLVALEQVVELIRKPELSSPSKVEAVLAYADRMIKNTYGEAS